VVQLRELVGLVAATLTGDIAKEDRELVQHELEGFNVGAASSVIRAGSLTNSRQPESSQVSAALSRRIEQDATLLAKMLGMSEPLSMPDISEATSRLLDDISHQTLQLSQSRMDLLRDAHDLDGLYRQIMEASIRILEQTIHGAVSRSTKTKADYLATMAEGMSKKLSIQHAQLNQEVYSSEVREALKTKAETLQTESAGLRMKIRWAEDKLEQYRKARGMEGMAKEYTEIVKESQRVREEIERLEAGR
jgi:hypothetical protein